MRRVEGECGEEVVGKTIPPSKGAEGRKGNRLRTGGSSEPKRGKGVRERIKRGDRPASTFVWRCRFESSRSPLTDRRARQGPGQGCLTRTPGVTSLLVPEAGVWIDRRPSQCRTVDPLRQVLIALVPTPDAFDLHQSSRAAATKARRRRGGGGQGANEEERRRRRNPIGSNVTRTYVLR